MSDADVVEVGEGIETSLLIPSITVEDGGRYFCTAQLNGDTVAAEAYFNITKGVLSPSDYIGPKFRSHSGLVRARGRAEHWGLVLAWAGLVEQGFGVC